MKTGFDQYYDEAVEPGMREKAYSWSTSIGLQEVDGLKPSAKLYETARRHIEGEITQEEARQIVDAYYETKEGHDQPPDVREADLVATRMIAVINSPTFTFSPAYLIALHGKIFEGVFSHAGKVREVELTKKEEVLNGDTVEYAPSFMIERTLDYDFDKEHKFDYKGITEDGFVRHFAAFIAGIWQIHPFREGNTRTTAIFAIKYLRSKGFDVTNDLFAKKSLYFRNALVRANYENTKLDVVKSPIYLEEFFKVLLYGEEIELRSRFLKIGFECGTKAADAIAEIHRKSAIETEKSAIDREKSAIDALQMQFEALDVSQPTKNHLHKLLERFGVKDIFGRGDIAACVGVKYSNAGTLLEIMKAKDLVEPVSGHGKGKVRFKVVSR